MRRARSIGQGPDARPPPTGWPRAALDGRFAAALVVLLSLASLSVAAATGSASRGHVERLAAEVGE